MSYLPHIPELAQDFTPKALNIVAQGRERGERTLGWKCHRNSILKGLYNRKIARKRDVAICRTPSGFFDSLQTITQGGAASPLTLGYDVLPLWGISRVTNISI